MIPFAAASRSDSRPFTVLRSLPFSLLLTLSFAFPSQADLLGDLPGGDTGCGVTMTCTGPGLPGTGPVSNICVNNGAGNPCGPASGPASQNASTTGQNVGAGNPLNVLSGNKYQVEVDLPPLPGILGLEIVRHYNSQYARPNVASGIFGRGWKLSYETALYVVKNTVQIVQADGTRIIFSRDAKNPSVCATTDPSRGKVLVRPTPRGEEYVWVWPDGRRLFFDVQKKLTQIVAPTGEFVSLTRDAAGALLKVTDPQGRSLTLSYGSTAEKDTFRGVRFIDSPVGRFAYAYGSVLPAGAEAQAKEAGSVAQVVSNLVSVTLPATYAATEKAHPFANRGTTQSAVTRSYHYESAKHPTLLTGISVRGTGSDGVPMQVRVASWDYDDEARAILSVKGDRSAAGATAATGTAATAEATTGTKATTAAKQDGPETVRLAFPAPGTTVLTNSLGQTTTYRWAQIAGELRLLEAIGPGCASCGPTNVRYAYDAAGRLSVSSQLDAQGRPMVSTRQQRDAAGRVVREERVRFVKGKAVPAGWVDFAYAAVPAGPSAGASPSSAEPEVSALPDPKPRRVIRPSVVAGKTHEWRYAYNAAGQVLSVTESGFAPALPDEGKRGEPTPIERTTTYTYTTVNGRSLLASIDGPLPNGAKGEPADSDVSTFTWDRRGDFVASVTAPGNIATTFSRDDTGRVAVRTVDDGGIALPSVRLEHTPRGLVLTVARDASPASEAPLSFWARAWHTVREWVAGEAPPASPPLAATLTYDALDRPVRLTRPDGTWIEAAYDAAGRPASVRDQDGNALKQAFDGEGRRTLRQWLAGATEAPQDLTTRYAYDDAHRLTQIEAPGGALTEFTYSPDAGLRAIRDALGRTVTFETDALGRLREASLAAPEFGPVTLARFAAGGATGKADTTGKDDVPAATIVAGNGARARQAVDDFGRRVWAENADSGRQLASYDALDRLREVVDARGRVMRLQRNAAGQVLERTITGPGPDGTAATETTTFRYAGTRLIEMANAHQRTLFDYDAAGRLREKREQLVPVGGQSGAWDFVTRYGYDALGRRVSESLPGGGTLHIAWSASGRPTGIDFVRPDGTRSPLLTDIRSSALSGIASFTHGNGLQTTLRHDPATGRLVELSVNEPAPPGRQKATGPAWFAVAHAAGATTPVYGQTMAYDVLGRLTDIARTSTATGARQEERFVFDALDRLQAAASPGETRAWTYDANGNRLTETATTGSDTPTRALLAYAPQSNRLVRTEADGQETRLTYDATGNPLTIGMRTLAYNPSGRLATVDEADRPLARYAYNASGMRVAKTTFGTDGSPQTRYFLYDGHRLTAEIDDRGLVRAHYVYLGLAPVVKLDYAPQQITGPPGWFERVRGWLSFKATDEGPRVLAIHADHLGAPRRVTDEQRKTVWAADYAPFGRTTVAPESTVSLELRFPGQIFDAETGTHYNGFRDYDPQTGRYRSSDPLGIEAGLNTYAYVNGNPVQLVDPWGLKQYVLGPGKPTISPDMGAGPWDSQWLFLIPYSAAKASILAGLPFVKDKPNAVKHLKHYFGNSGSALTIDLAGLIQDAQAGYDGLYEEIDEAVAFAEIVAKPGVCTMISSSKLTTKYANESDSPDWYFATGGFSLWGEGAVSVDTNGVYSMTFTLNYFDRYNWDGGKAVEIGGVTITDAMMGGFHLHGIAKEFDMTGSITKTLTWKKGTKPVFE